MMHPWRPSRSACWRLSSRPDGIQPHLLEYKLRRHVNDYICSRRKSGHRLERGLDYFLRANEELEQLGAREPHELMRALECHFIRDCAEMAARASLYARTESRWGLYHYRQDFPEMDDEGNWFVHVNLKRGGDGGDAIIQTSRGTLCSAAG